MMLLTAFSNVMRLMGTPRIETLGHDRVASRDSGDSKRFSTRSASCGTPARFASMSNNLPALCFSVELSVIIANFIVGRDAVSGTGRRTLPRVHASSFQRRYSVAGGTALEAFLQDYSLCKFQGYLRSTIFFANTDFRASSIPSGVPLNYS